VKAHSLVKPATSIDSHQSFVLYTVNQGEKFLFQREKTSAFFSSAPEKKALVFSL
jgi:hypothetical protein